MPRHNVIGQPTPLDAVSQPVEPEMPDRSSDPALLTLDQVAAVLGMSVKSVQRRIKAGLIQKAPLGGRLVRISSGELRRLTGGGVILEAPENADLD